MHAASRPATRHVMSATLDRAPLQSPFEEKQSTNLEQRPCYALNLRIHWDELFKLRGSPGSDMVCDQTKSSRRMLNYGNFNTLKCAPHCAILVLPEAERFK